ncbi:MAG TPA: hypothetical protein VFR09_01045, partial [Alphaproteobacteria bacterium]|nr:hypothetical protein [Alphaproteobacteria bacterium]
YLELTEKTLEAVARLAKMGETEEDADIHGHLNVAKLQAARDGFARYVHPPEQGGTDTTPYDQETEKKYFDYMDRKLLITDSDFHTLHSVEMARIIDARNKYDPAFLGTGHAFVQKIHRRYKQQLRNLTAN